MKLPPDSPLYQDIFGPYPLLTDNGKFEGGGPTFSTIRNAFLSEENVALFSNDDALNGVQSQDMRLGMRLLMYDLAVPQGSDAFQPELISINIPTVLVESGLPQVVGSETIGDVLSNDAVRGVFNALASGDPKKAAGIVLGVGMGLVGIAVPIVGWIGSAIIAVAAAISGAFKRAKAKAAADYAKQAAALYSEFPPMQVGGADMDADTVNKVIRPIVRTHDWTNIWLPSFKGDFVGTSRQGGFAFAQGSTLAGDDEVANDKTKFFVPTGGLGVIPGTDQLTRVIQVSLETNPADIDSGPWMAFKGGSGPDPRGLDINGYPGWKRIKDTGMYYPTTGRLAASLWEMLMNRTDYGYHGNPYLYRIDPKRMHEAWGEWAAAGLRYIREVCYPWYPKHSLPEGGVDAQLNVNAQDPAVDLVGYAGTAIYYAMGVWAGTVIGGSSTHPIYSQAYPRPNGTAAYLLENDPKAYGWPKSSVSSLYSGAFLPILDPDKWPDHLMGDRYNRGPLGVSIHDTLVAVQKQQSWMLRNTLVSAYCSQFDAVFAGPANQGARDNLIQIRKRLLEHQDRYAINLLDVPDNEPSIPYLPAGKTWKDQLIASGVPLPTPQVKKPKLSGGAHKPGEGIGGGIPCEAGIPCEPQTPAPYVFVPQPPAPYIFVPGNPDPWEPQKPKRVGRPNGKPSTSGGLAGVLGVSAAAAIGAGLALAYRLRNTKRRSFSAGRMR